MSFDDGIDPIELLTSSDGPAMGTWLRAPTERTEVQLLNDAANGEAVALKAILDIHMPTVYGFVLARLGGRSHVADDLMQETLEEAIRSAHTFRGDASLATWLCAIARRRIARYYEHERRNEEAGGVLIVLPEPAEDGLERRDQVLRALGTLPASQRQALVLKYVDDLSVEGVAREMGKSTVQVQSLLQRARERLKRSLEETAR
jgi:RNA polymerase sigma-70 factor (ECF subfamily)